MQARSVKRSGPECHVRASGGDCGVAGTPSASASWWRRSPSRVGSLHAGATDFLSSWTEDTQPREAHCPPPFSSHPREARRVVPAPPPTAGHVKIDIQRRALRPPGVHCITSIIRGTRVGRLAASESVLKNWIPCRFSGLLNGNGERKREHRPAPPALHPDPAAMRLDDRSGDRQSEPRPASLPVTGRIGPVETVKHPPERLRLDPVAAICHGDLDLTIRGQRAQPHPATGRRVA